MWGDEVTVERGGGRRPRWVFRYPHEKWHSDCINPDTRTSEKKVSQMMTGCFSGSGLGMLVRVFKDPESVGVTGRSIIKEFDTFFMDVVRRTDSLDTLGGKGYPTLRKQTPKNQSNTPLRPGVGTARHHRTAG